MRFVLWAQEMPLRALTPQRIADELDVGLNTARQWRNDFLAALSPIAFDGMPDYPRPQQARSQ